MTTQTFKEELVALLRKRAASGDGRVTRVTVDWIDVSTAAEQKHEVKCLGMEVNYDWPRRAP